MRIPLIVLAEARESERFLLFPNEPEEYHYISLICNADVGSPQGTIKIWKMFQNNGTLKLIYASNDTSERKETENCTELINVIHTVTRDDNGAIFRCSSQNNLTQDPGPYRDSSKITVICMYTIVHDYIIFHGLRFHLQHNLKTF